MYNKRLRVRFKKDEPLSPERIKKIREQGLKDYQHKLVSIKEEISVFQKERDLLVQDIEEKKKLFANWIEAEEKSLNVKRKEFDDYIKRKKEKVCEKIQEELQLIRENNKILERIKASEVETAYNLRKTETTKKDAIKLIEQSKVAEERATAKVKEYRALMQQYEDLLDKTNRKLAAVQEAQDNLIFLKEKYEYNIKKFQTIRKEVIAKENELALAEIRISEKLDKINQIAKEEGDEL